MGQVYFRSAVRFSGQRVRRAAVVAALAVAAIAAAAIPTQAAEKVTYLLPSPQYLPAFGPWVLAKSRGYYAAEGLDVEFQTANGGADVAKQVGVGNAVIGGALGDTPIIVRSHGVPVKSVAVMGGGSLTEVIVRADGPIHTPADLKGKTVTVRTFQETTYYGLLGMLAHFGLTKDDVNIQAAGATNIWAMLVSGQADAAVASPERIVDIRKAGVPVRVMPATDYFPSMAQAILASDEAIAQKPKLIGSLVRATLHGMKDIMDDPKAAAHDYVIAGGSSDTTREAEVLEVFTLYNELIYRGQKVLGEMDGERLATLQDFYLKQGVIEKASPPADLYTNEFIR